MNIIRVVPLTRITSEDLGKKRVGTQIHKRQELAKLKYRKYFYEHTYRNPGQKWVFELLGWQLVIYAGTYSHPFYKLYWFSPGEG